MAERGTARVARRAGPGSAAKGGSARGHLRLIEERPRTARDARYVARRDLVLLMSSAGFLTATGVVMVLSVGSVSSAQGYGNPFWYFQRQAVYAAVGIACAVVVGRARPAIWKKLSVPLLGASAILMLVAAHPASGVAVYGASRWIDLGPFTMQPSEVAKLGLVSFSATVLARKWDKIADPMHLILPLGPVVAIVAGLGMLQRDLGTTVILSGSVFLLLFAAGARLRHLAIAAFLGLASASLMIASEAYRRTRFFDSWLNPWADPQKTGYQLIQGLIAIGSGGWFGTGLGSSRAKWDFLPNAHSDFIFAVIGEEVGLAGAVVILAVFALLILAGIRIAVHASGTFERLLAAGVISWIGLQTVINLGAVTGLLPITGVPLPLVSFGGTALVVTLVGVGVLASIARAQTVSGNGRAAGRRVPSRKAGS